MKSLRQRSRSVDSDHFYCNNGTNDLHYDPQLLCRSSSGGGEGGDGNDPLQRFSKRRRTELYRSFGHFTREVHQYLDHMFRAVMVGQASPFPIHSSPPCPSFLQQQEHQQGAQERILRASLQHCVHLLNSFLSFKGNAGDCFEPRQSLHPIEETLLLHYAKFSVTLDGHYVVLPRAALGWAAATREAIQLYVKDSHSITRSAGMTSTRVQEYPFPHHPLTELTLCVCPCRGFGWATNEDYRPAISSALRSLIKRAGGTSQLVVVATDVMLSDAGAPLLCRQLGLSMFSLHERYGVGTAVLAPREVLSNSCVEELRIDNVLVGQAVLLFVANQRPLLLIHVHFVGDATGPTLNQVSCWLELLGGTPLPLCVVLTGRVPAPWQQQPPPPSAGAPPHTFSVVPFPPIPPCRSVVCGTATGALIYCTTDVVFHATPPTTTNRHHHYGEMEGTPHPPQPIHHHHDPHHLILPMETIPIFCTLPAEDTAVIEGGTCAAATGLTATTLLSGHAATGMGSPSPVRHQMRQRRIGSSISQAEEEGDLDASEGAGHAVALFTAFDVIHGWLDGGRAPQQMF